MILSPPRRGGVNAIDVLKYSPDSRLLFVATELGGVDIWAIGAQELRQSLQMHRVAGGQNGTIRTWDLSLLDFATRMSVERFA